MKAGRQKVQPPRGKHDVQPLVHVNWTETLPRLIATHPCRILAGVGVGSLPAEANHGTTCQRPDYETPV